ncbi:MAG: hypothetical protein ABI175_29545 [Polyangiales bacterium]
MAAHVSLPASRSRPPIVKASHRPHEIAAMDVAFALAISLEAHALESIVVLDRAQHVVASAGRAAPTRALAAFAAGMSEGEPVGSSRSFDEGRVHVEIVTLCGVPCVVAVRGQVMLDDPLAITEALRLAFVRDDDEPVADERRVDDDDDDFDFDLGWGDSPTDALRDVVG